VIIQGLKKLTALTFLLGSEARATLPSSITLVYFTLGIHSRPPLVLYFFQGHPHPLSLSVKERRKGGKEK
jgi:hypothetical protein